MRRFHTVAWSTTAPNATLFAVTVTLLAGLAITLTPGVSDAVFQSMDAEPTGAASVAPTRPNLVVSGIGPSG